MQGIRFIGLIIFGYAAIWHVGHGHAGAALLCAAIAVWLLVRFARRELHQ